MAGTVKKLQFSEGTDVGAPTDLGIATSSKVITAYVDDAAYVLANGAAVSGSVYLNTTENVFKYYTGSAWRSAVPKYDSADPTKFFLVDLTGNTTGKGATLTFANTLDRTYTFPNFSGTVATTGGTETLTAKTLTAPLITTNGSIDVTGAGTLAIGASMGANNMTLGGATSTVIVAGDLTVQGTNTILNTTVLDVEDKNIKVNVGGNDASSEGAGIEVNRTSTHGSIIYAAAAASKFKVGALGSEVEVADIATAQSLTNKTLSTGTVVSTGSLVDSGVSFTDNGDATKKMQFELSGITTGTTRTLTVPDANLTIAGIATAQILTNKDIDGGTMTNTNRLTLPKETTTNLAALTRKQGNFAYDTTLAVPVYDTGSAFVALATSATAQDSAFDAKNYTLTATVGSSALTVTLKTKAGATPSAGDAVNIAFRNATATTGDYSLVSVTAATTVVVSSGSTLGHRNAISTPIYVYALNNAGTVELAVSSLLYDEGTVQTTLAEGGAGAADSLTAIYSTTARTSKAIRLIGRLLSTQATAGTWASVPTEISLFTGQRPSNILGKTLVYTGFLTSSGTPPALGTGGTSLGTWWRYGDRMKLHWGFNQTATGTAGTGTYLLGLPTGYTIDTNKTPNNSAAFDDSVGFGYMNVGATEYNCVVYVHSNTQLRVDLFASATATITWNVANASFGGNANYRVGLNADVAIVEFDMPS